MRHSTLRIQYLATSAVVTMAFWGDSNLAAQTNVLEQRRREANAAMNSMSARQTADQAARLQALARKNAANRARVQAAYKRRPPEAEYTRTGRHVLHNVIEKNIADRNLNADSEYRERLQKWEEAYDKSRRRYEAEKAALLKVHEISLKKHREARVRIDEEYRAAMKPFRSARTGFFIVGTRAQVIEPALSVDVVLGSSEFVCAKYKWLCEVEINSLRGKVFQTQKRVFEVLGYHDAKDLPAKARALFKIGTKLVRIRITDGGIERPAKAEYPPAPKPPELPAMPDKTSRPTPEDVPEDAREFQVNGTSVVCSYIDRLRVRSRKYDVFFAVKNGTKYYLAWCPFTDLSKTDQEWLGAEDRRRREEERQRASAAGSSALTEGGAKSD